MRLNSYVVVLTREYVVQAVSAKQAAGVVEELDTELRAGDYLTVRDSSGARIDEYSVRRMRQAKRMIPSQSVGAAQW